MSEKSKLQTSSPTQVEKSKLRTQRSDAHQKDSVDFKWKRRFFYFFAIGLVLVCLTGVFVGLYVFFLSTTLPNLVTADAYNPRLVSEVFDINGEKVGEFFREKRKLIEIEDIPPKLMQAFIAAEDASFYEHQGINYLAILRALMVNLREGRKVQGGSTITQQVARSLLLTREKTYTRKLKEILLAYKMEANLTKEEILYLYLNQIYLGSGVYGVVVAAEVYFRKDIKDLTLEEIAILAGLPQAPSRYSPIINPKAAKNRQRYVLQRMEDQGFISKEEKEKTLQKDVRIYFRKSYEQSAPYYVETVRQQLVRELGEDTVLDQGVKVYTAMDLKKQIIAQESLKAGLRQIDKRQGYRGAKDHIEEAHQIDQFLLKVQKSLMDDKNPSHIINSEGEAKKESQLPLPSPLVQEDTNIPNYIEKGEIIEGVVTHVDDRWGLVTVRFPESRGLIDIESMKWATPPDPNVHWKFRNINKPSQALKKGDVIEVKVVGEVFRSTRLSQLRARSKRLLAQEYKFEEFALLELEQEPLVQGALVSVDLKTENLIAMVGGRNFQQSKFNRAIQALRQSGSSFKPIIYLSALDKGFKPNSVITDSPIIYKEKPVDEEEETFTWRPGNYSSRFEGDTLLRNALKQSKNIPTVKILEQIGVEWVVEYAKRLGIFHPLNMDLSLGLGSSSVTLYEMTKVFAHIARLGKRLSPLIINKVENMKEENILGQISMDQRFKDQITKLDNQFALKRIEFLSPFYADSNDDDSIANQEQKEDVNEITKTSESDELIDQATQPLIFFEDSKQLIIPQTAYLITTLLKAVVEESGGTGARARGLGRTSAGKTGTTNGYFDAWYIGYTPQFVTGVWVGFDDEKTLGRGETGSSAALPIWLEYMKQIHEGLPKEEFIVPDQIVFANIDNETGYLASASSKDVVMQAFLEGTQPTSNTEDSIQLQERQTVDFYKKDLSE